MVRTTALLAALSVLVQGCAMTGKEAVQTIRVETPGCEHVSCEFSNDRGSWQLPRTPGSVTVTTSHEPLKVSCRSDDGVEVSFAAPSSVPPVTGGAGVAGGVAAGAGVGAALGATALTFIPLLGVFAVVTGVAVGAVTGTALESSQREIRYPDLITIPMSCHPPGASAQAPGAPLGLGIRGLPVAQAREVGLGERGGVLVTSVAEGSSAAAAGLRAGDIILAAAGQELRDAGDMEERVIVLTPGAPLTLQVWRDGQVIELVLTRPVAAP